MARGDFSNLFKGIRQRRLEEKKIGQPFRNETLDLVQNPEADIGDFLEKEQGGPSRGPASMPNRSIASELSDPIRYIQSIGRPGQRMTMGETPGGYDVNQGRPVTPRQRHIRNRSRETWRERENKELEQLNNLSLGQPGQPGRHGYEQPRSGPPAPPPVVSKHPGHNPVVDPKRPRVGEVNQYGVIDAGPEPTGWDSRWEQGQAEGGTPDYLGAGEGGRMAGKQGPEVVIPPPPKVITNDKIDVSTPGLDEEVEVKKPKFITEDEISITKGKQEGPKTVIGKTEPKSRFRAGKIPDVYESPKEPTDSYEAQAHKIANFDPTRAPEGYDMDEAPVMREPREISRAQKYKTDLPENYTIDKAPEVRREREVTVPQRNPERAPEVYEAGTAPEITPFRKRRALEEFKTPAPEVYENKPIRDTTIRDKEFEKARRDPRLGRVRDVRETPNFRDTEIRREKGPGKLRSLEDFKKDSKVRDIKIDPVTTDAEEYKMKEFKKNPWTAAFAALSDIGDITAWRQNPGRAFKAVAAEQKREADFIANERKYKNAVEQRNIKDREMDRLDNKLQADIQNMGANRDLKLSDNDMKYILEGHKLGVNEMKARIQETFGNNQITNAENRLISDDTQNIRKAEQEQDKANINAQKSEHELDQSAVESRNKAVKAKADIQDAEDKANFERDVETGDLIREQNDAKFKSWKEQQRQFREGQQDRGKVEEFNIGQEDKEREFREERFQSGEKRKQERYDRELSKFGLDNKTYSQWVNAKTDAEKANAVNQIAVDRLGYDVWNGMTRAKKEQYMAEIQKDIQNFNVHKNYQTEDRLRQQDNIKNRMEKDKSDIDTWKFKSDFKKKKFDSYLNKYKAVHGVDAAQKEEQRLTHALNERNNQEESKSALEYHKGVSQERSRKFNDSLSKWKAGRGAEEFDTEQERKRFADENLNKFRKESNLLKKYGIDVDKWIKDREWPHKKAMDKLNIDLKQKQVKMADKELGFKDKQLDYKGEELDFKKKKWKDEIKGIKARTGLNEAQAKWYVQKTKDLIDGKSEPLKPLELSKFIRTSNKDWTKSDEFQSYHKANQATNSILSAPKTGAGDFVAFYNFIKAVDRDSAVREGERDFAISVLGWFGDPEKALKDPTISDEIKALFNNRGVGRIVEKIKSGQLMDDKDRKLFHDASKAATAATFDAYKNRYNKMKSIWSKDPDLKDRTNDIMTVERYKDPDEEARLELEKRRKKNKKGKK
jgi:hypothetical protein